MLSRPPYAVLVLVALSILALSCAQPEPTDAPCDDPSLCQGAAESVYRGPARNAASPARDPSPEVNALMADLAQSLELSGITKAPTDAALAEAFDTFVVKLTITPAVAAMWREYFATITANRLGEAILSLAKSEEAGNPARGGSHLALLKARSLGFYPQAAISDPWFTAVRDWLRVLHARYPDLDATALSQRVLETLDAEDYPVHQQMRREMQRQHLLDMAVETAGALATLGLAADAGILRPSDVDRMRQRLAYYVQERPYLQLEVVPRTVLEAFYATADIRRAAAARGVTRHWTRSVDTTQSGRIIRDRGADRQGLLQTLTTLEQSSKPSLPATAITVNMLAGRLRTTAAQWPFGAAPPNRFAWNDQPGVASGDPTELLRGTFPLAADWASGVYRAWSALITVDRFEPYETTEDATALRTLVPEVPLSPRKAFMLDRATRTQATANIEIEVTRFLEAIRRGAELPDRRSQLPTAQTRSALTPAELSLVWTSVRAQWRIDNPTNLPEDLRLVIADQMSNSYLLQDNYNRLRRNATAELIPSLIAAQGIIDFIVQAGQLAPEARTIMRRWLTDEIGAPCNLPHFFIACLFGPAEQRAEFVDRLASALAQANIALPETPLPQLVREAADRYGSPASAAWWWWLQGLTRARPNDSTRTLKGTASHFARIPHAKRTKVRESAQTPTIAKH